MYVLYKSREIKVHENSWLFKLPILSNFTAITLGSFFFKGKYDESIIKHELVHIDQIIKEGKIMFYAKYVLEFLQNLFVFGGWMKSYYNISFEIEAYNNAHLVKGYRIVNED